ncbi:hypothetical protein [Azospirillum argentinense]|uniref:hypothetical protein n=1 Tax=Azospirillum argentinense TaxID=2970906 RepID=UPI0032DF2B60
MDEKKPDRSWPAWFYGPRGEVGIFDRKEDVPKGWADSPAKFKTTPAPAEPTGDQP